VLLVFAGGGTGVADAAWTSSPQTVTAGPENVFSLAAAPGPEGTTNLVWDDYLDSTVENTIHLARIPLGGTPSTPVRLNPNSPSGLSPKIAAGPDGGTSVVWTTNSGEEYLAQVSPSGIADSPVALPVHYVATAVAIDANEVTTTAWTEGGPLMYERVSPEGVADQPVTVPEAGGGWDGEVTARADREGNVLIAWAHADSSNHWSLEMTVVNPAGVASPPVTLASTPAETRIEILKTAVNAKGDALFTWTDATPVPQTPEEIEQEIPNFNPRYTYSSYFELVPHGALSGGARHVTAPEGGDFRAVTPALYSDGRGLLAATYWQGGGMSLEALPVDGGGTAGAPVSLPTPEHRLGAFALDVDAKGVATLSWLEGERTVQMMASRIPDGGEPEAPVSLASGTELGELASTVDTRGDVTLATTSGQGTPILTRQWIYPSDCLDGASSTGQEVTTLITLSCEGAGSLSYVLEGAPAHGTATLDRATGVVTYTPVPGFTGVDTFTFKATSQAGESRLGTFTITVEPPPGKAGPPPPTTPAESASPAPPGSGSPVPSGSVRPRPPLGLSGLRLSSTALPRQAHRRHALKAAFLLSGSAHVTLAITRVYGRWVGPNCRRTPFVGHRYQRRCHLSQPAVTQSLGSLAAGQHHLMIPASTIRHLLRPGAYKLTLTASGAGGRTAIDGGFIVHWQG
jgi:hypothetical protein